MTWIAQSNADRRRTAILRIALPSFGLGILAIRQDFPKEKIFPSLRYGKFFLLAIYLRKRKTPSRPPFRGKRPQTPAILIFALAKNIYYTQQTNS